MNIFIFRELAITILSTTLIYPFKVTNKYMDIFPDNTSIFQNTSGQLKAIVENGCITHIINKISLIVKINRKLTATAKGWKKVARFNGSCQVHKNELFKPIDNISLECE